MTNLSIIIPTLNEIGTIRQLVDSFLQHEYADHLEIIVVDGGSTDGTLDAIAGLSGVRTFTTRPSRPVQMNHGAAKATHDLLYFVHADVQLPCSFYTDLIVASDQYQAGCYRYRFVSSNPLLQINGFFSRFPMMWCRGGDQTLFIQRSLFHKLNGFNESFCVMEDFDLIRRIKSITPFYIIPKSIRVSARKYDHNSYFKVQLANLAAFRMYRKGDHPEKIRHYYKSKLGLVDY